MGLFGDQSDYGIRSIAAVDYDDTFLTMYESAAKKVGVKHFHGFTSSAAFLEYTSKRKVDLILTEWKIDQIPGYVLIQLLKNNQKTALTPVLVCSSILKKADVFLLSELEIHHYMSKPFVLDALQKKFVEISRITEAEQEAQGHRIVFEEAMAKKKFLKAEMAVNQIFEIDAQSPRHQILHARLLTEQKNYKAAVVILKKILAGKRRFIPALTLLGRVYSLLGDFDNAVFFMNQAKSLSPKNLSRILALGEIELKKGEVKSATESMKEVFEAYPGFPDVKEKLLKVSLSAGKTKTSRKLYDDIGNKEDLGAYLNNHGVGLIRTGKFNEGLEFYHNALKALPKSKVSFRLLYNIALAYYRQGKLEQALNYLNKSIKENGKFKKSRVLKWKINKMLAPVEIEINKEGVETIPIGIPSRETLGLYIFNDRLIETIGEPYYEIAKATITSEEWQKICSPLLKLQSSGTLEITRSEEGESV